MRSWLVFQIKSEFAPSVRQNGKNSDLLASICMKQASRGLGTPVPAVLLGAATQPQCFRFAEDTPPTPSAPFFGYAKNLYMEIFPRKSHQSWATPIYVMMIKVLRC